MGPRVKRSAFTPTARDEQRKIFRCSRCGRVIREGESALVLRGAETVETRHRGAKCPPAYVRPTAPSPSRYVN